MAMMMTEMMASFKQDFLTQFEDYFSSSALEEGPRRDLPTPSRLKTASLQPSLMQWLPILTLRQKQLHHSRLPLPTSQRSFPLQISLAHLLTNNWLTLSTNYAKISCRRRNLMPCLSNIIDRATATILSLRKSIKLSGSS